MGRSLLTITCADCVWTSERDEITIMWPVNPMFWRITWRDSDGDMLGQPTRPAAVIM